jgi:ubiquinone/menaquinone biosynthesis C-methylase UbiE
VATVDPYSDRRLVDGYPDIESVSTEWFSNSLSRDTTQRVRVEKVLAYLERLIGVESGARLAVVGCGPHPEAVKILIERGFRAVGIEPVEGYVEAARDYLGDDADVRQGSAESLPLEDESQDVVFLESVLEHVDSPIVSLREAYRVLEPGGVAFVVTTNRLRFSPTGANGEFNVRFYNWLPALVKEGYVFLHLHRRPDLANYTPRPAVHWFTYQRLCELGRAAGFAQFYSHVDLVEPNAAGRPKRDLVRLVQRNAWVRALALTQVGGVVFMWKRSDRR